MQVPPTPAWQTWLFEQPWPLVAALVFTAAALAVVANRRAAQRVWIASGVALLLAVGAVLSARFVETDRERLTRQLHAALDATTPYDDPAFAALLTERAVLTDAAGDAYLPNVLWRRAFDLAFDRHPVDRHKVVEWEVGVSGPTRAVGELRLTTWMSEQPSVPHRTTWGLVFERPDAASDAWRVSELRCLTYNGREPSEVLRFLGPAASGGAFSFP